MIKTIIWIVVLVLALSFFGISLRGLWNAPQTQDNFTFIVDLLKHGWNVIVHFVTVLAAQIKHPVNI